MERLTARTEKRLAYLVNVKPDEQVVESPYKNTLQCILDCFERLAYYEDLEEQRQCVVLPFPIGTKVYIVVRHGVLHGKILENVVCGYSENEWQGSINKGKDSRFVICHNSYNMPSAYELRDVFLTCAEAEEALKEVAKNERQHKTV